MTTKGSELGGPADGEAALSNRIELVIPARPELLFLARMTAAAVASRADFGYDRIEDLRLALDELCLALLQESSAHGRLHLSLSWCDDAVEVVATLEDAEHANRAREVDDHSFVPGSAELSERILDALVDSHGSHESDGMAVSWLRMSLHGG